MGQCRLPSQGSCAMQQTTCQASLSGAVLSRRKRTGASAKPSVSAAALADAADAAALSRRQLSDPQQGSQSTPRKTPNKALRHVMEQSQTSSSQGGWTREWHFRWVLDSQQWVIRTHTDERACCRPCDTDAFDTEHEREWRHGRGVRCVARTGAGAHANASGGGIDGRAVAASLQAVRVLERTASDASVSARETRVALRHQRRRRRLLVGQTSSGRWRRRRR